VGSVTDTTRIVRGYAGLVAHDVLRRHTRPATLDAHLEAAVRWLEHAHDRTARRGVSYGYSLRGGWKPAYRETSGYIIPTLYRAADALGRPELEERAVEVARWLLHEQRPDGSFANPHYGPDGIVFDTGQVLFGLVRAFERTGDDDLLAAAERAGQWLARVADGDGRWRTHEHFGTPHVYNTRTAWALLRLDEVAHDDRRVSVARANLDWAVRSQRPSGFFDDAAFTPGADAFTHTISYTICGLQESGWLLGDDTYVAAARRCADATVTLLADDGSLPGRITTDGAPASRSVCLTGNCQFSIVWAKWFELTGDERYRDAATRALSRVLATHRIEHPRSEFAGAVAGSSPVWGRYAPMSHPNWAAKFLVDAALLQRAWRTDDG
jgi:uncharacterized protein YyaL (SSP411 family)